MRDGTSKLIHRSSDEISTSTVIDQVFKTALQTMANITDGLPFPFKAVAQTVLQLHQHVEVGVPTWIIIHFFLTTQFRHTAGSIAA